MSNLDDLIKELKQENDKLYKETYDLGILLRKERMAFALKLEENIKINLNDLELKNTNFKICFNDIDDNVTFYNNGLDSIDFLVSFNKGEDMKPLSKVASGGELSRFMLALKVVLGDDLPQQTKIFDEIDSGVSGHVAHSIALKIHEISKKSQVLCITHLAQVASISEYHYKISKKVEDNKTYTIIEELNGENRVMEIAKMLANGNLTDASVALAKELLNN